MKEIDADGRSVRELLSGKKYSVDYYQREYRWETKQVRELIEDLTGAFLEHYDPDDERQDVGGYGHYFLGSIIISQKNGARFIVDGQQRLTTLTLLLIYLHNRQGIRPDRVKLEDLIYSEKFGQKSFNLNVPERTACIEALYSDHAFDDSDQPESIRNIVSRFTDIRTLFPEKEIDEKALPFFADWLVDRVHLVEITAQSDDDAYTIFVTMNDRGLSLTPTDMLKGYLLANIQEGKDRTAAGDIWKRRVGALVDFGKEEDADALKAWLRSQYAQTIRERKRAATPGDFDKLGTEFHRWIRENAKTIGLSKSADFGSFIRGDLEFYTRQYLRLRNASERLTEGLETVFYNAQQDFTLQYPLLLAPLKPTDPDKDIDLKIRIVANFVDILLARRLWSFKSISYSTMQYSMFLVMRGIRRKTAKQVVPILTRRLGEEQDFGKNDRFQLHERNRPTVMLILARMIDFIERGSGMPSHYEEYALSKGKKKYEVEHIWADHHERFREEFPHEADFREFRNRIGGLLLLPKAFNASYGDLIYEKKLPHYYGQNILAQSLCPKCYEHNPGFKKFRAQSGLPFKAYEHFKRKEVDERQRLYTSLAEQIWTTDRLKDEVTE